MQAGATENSYPAGPVNAESYGAMFPKSLEESSRVTYASLMRNFPTRLLPAESPKFFTQVGYGGYKWVPNLTATDQVTKAIAPKVLQLKAEDYLTMPGMLKIEREGRV